MAKIKKRKIAIKKKLVAKKKKVVAKKTLRRGSGRGKISRKPKTIIEMSKEKFDYFMEKIAAI